MLFDRSKTISASTALGIVTHDKHSGPKAAGRVYPCQAQALRLRILEERAKGLLVPWHD